MSNYYSEIDNTTVFVNTNPIPEPLSTVDLLSEHLKRFDLEIYNTSADSHLYLFLSALCGDSGAGLLAKQTAFARFQSRLDSTFFNDLDLFFRDALGLPRLNSEQYNRNNIDNVALNPRAQVLQPDQWNEVILKDAAYRARCLAWTKALMLGGTPEGMAMAAQAAIGVECDIYENYKYVDAVARGDNSQPNVASSSNRKEFVIIPQLPENEVTEEMKYYLYKLVNRIKPVGSYFTINYNATPRLLVEPLKATSSSNYFYVTRNVTGNSSINWPTVDSTNGYWIQSSVSNPAPSFAFLQTQEYSTWFTLNGVIDYSSYHIGTFNKQQQAFFSHLRDKSSPPKEYLSSYSFSVVNTPLSSTNAWLNNYGSSNTPLIVNNYYPLNYFTVANVQYPSNTQTRFWASNEGNAGTTEYITFDLGAERQCNFIDFQICQKPIQLKFEYSSDNVTWTEATFSSQYESTDQILFLPSENNPWFHYEAHFDTFLGRYVKITFTRVDELIYPGETQPFLWSIEIKNTRIGHQVNNLGDILLDSNGDYLPISGVDILSNKYTTSVTEFSASNVLDGNTSTYWQCSPTPSPQAVERLYFDLRLASSYLPGTQIRLDQNYQEGLDLLSQENIESIYTEGQVITEIYIDPVTIGQYMHFYYSDDDYSDWDMKLWYPINKHYVLQKGFFYLPRPIRAKYFKIEFTNLTPIPYNTIQYPQTPEITYDKYPTWVQNLFLDTFPISLNQSNLYYPSASVKLTTESVGFSVPKTILNEGRQELQPSKEQIDAEVTQQQKALLTRSTLTTNQLSSRNNVASTINIVNNTTYKNGLPSLLNLSNPVNNFLLNNTNNTTNLFSFSKERPSYSYSAPVNQSALDLNEAEVEKKMPIMYFPFSARHAYQTLNVKRTTKMAYIVGVKEVKFYRRQFGIKVDDPFYVETLDDQINVSQNDFSLNDWNYTVEV